MGASPRSGVARRTVAGEVDLLGDAATGTGMSEALLTAEVLAKHISRRRSHNWDWLAAFGPASARRSKLLVFPNSHGFFERSRV